jgi:hypothetical protein
MANHRYFAARFWAVRHGCGLFGSARGKKGPAIRRALSNRKLLRREVPRLGRFFLDDRIVLSLRLRTAARPLGQCGLDFLDRFGLGDPLHRRHFA